MTKLQAKEYTIKYLEPYLKEKGFTLVKTRHSGVKFKRKYKEGITDIIALGTASWGNDHMLDYSILRRFDEVEYHTEQIGKLITLNPPIDKDTVTIATGYDLFNNHSGHYLPYMSNEQETKVCCDMIVDFLDKQALPFLDHISSLKAIDEEINGENMWVHDIKKKFNLGGNFVQKQLIIAKLAKGSTHMMDVLNRSIEALKKPDPYVYDIDFDKLIVPGSRIDITIKYLKTVPDPVMDIHHD